MPSEYEPQRRRRGAVRLSPRRHPRQPVRSRPLPLAAPIDAANLTGTAGEIPVAPECAHARRLGARHGDVRCDPVFAVADHDLLPRTLAANRRHPAINDLRNLKDVGVALDIVDDLFLPHAKKRPDEDLEQGSRAAGAPSKNSRQRLHGMDRSLFIDEQGRRPAAAGERTRNAGNQADMESGQSGLAGTAVLDVDADPRLAIALGRRVLPQRHDAGTEHRAIARQHQIALNDPRLRHAKTPHIRGRIDAATVTTPVAIRTMPTARLKRAPASLSTAMISPRPAIHATFMTPTANITSIRAQQQPTQWRPWFTPMRKMRPGSVLQ